MQMNVNYNYLDIIAFKLNLCNFRSMKEMTSDEHFLKDECFKLD